jgi:hypothetical protein
MERLVFDAGQTDRALKEERRQQEQEHGDGECADDGAPDETVVGCLFRDLKIGLGTRFVCGRLCHLCHRLSALRVP